MPEVDGTAPNCVHAKLSHLMQANCLEVGLALAASVLSVRSDVPVKK